MMPHKDIGLVLPQMSLIATIGIAYSVISPIINGLGGLIYFKDIAKGLKLMRVERKL
jgi:hypothetical protein